MTVTFCSKEAKEDIKGLNSKVSHPAEKARISPVDRYSTA